VAGVVGIVISRVVYTRPWRARRRGERWEKRNRL
jgi:hypothetical protein